MKLFEALDMFINEKMSEGLSDKTIDYYEKNIGYFIDYIKNKDIEKISQRDVVNYRLYLVKKTKNEDHGFKTPGGQLSPMTVNSYLRALRAFLNYLEEYEMIEKLKVKMVKEPKRVIKMLDDEIILEIMKYPENGWVQQRNKLIIYLMLDSGLRRQEVLNLRVVDVDTIHDVIRVKNSKGNKDRNVPLGRITKKLYLKYLKNRPEDIEYVFETIYGDQLTENALKLIFQRLREKYHFDKFSPHFLRHNYATKFIINQYESVGIADIEQLRELLGHESTAVTRRYLHLANQHMIKTQQFGVLQGVQRKAREKKRPVYDRQNE